MALIECPECKNQVSDKAVTCPHCGFPIDQTLAQVNKSEDNELDEMHQQWLEMGYGPESFCLLENSLPMEEVNDLFENETLSPLLFNLLDYEENKSDKRPSNAVFAQRARNANVYMVMNLLDSGGQFFEAASKMLFFTDKYIFVAFISIEETAGRHIRKSTTDKSKCFVVPISCFSSIQFTTGEAYYEWQGSSGGTSTSVNVKGNSGSTVKGAVVGGILAGPTGAVIGAAVGSKNNSANVTVETGGGDQSTHSDIYIQYYADLRIKNNNSYKEIRCKLGSMNKYDQIDPFPDYRELDVIKINRYLFVKTRWDFYQIYYDYKKDEVKKWLPKYLDFVKTIFNKLLHSESPLVYDPSCETAILEALNDDKVLNVESDILSLDALKSEPLEKNEGLLCQLAYNKKIVIGLDCTDKNKSEEFYVALPGVIEKAQENIKKKLDELDSEASEKYSVYYKINNSRKKIKNGKVNYSKRGLKEEQSAYEDYQNVRKKYTEEEKTLEYRLVI